MKTKMVLNMVAIAIVGFLVSCSGKQEITQTVKNLKIAAIRETDLSATYKAYMIRAQNEYLPEVAKLFKALSIAESIHAANFLKILKSQNEEISNEKSVAEVDSSIYNLQNAIRTEVYEIDSLYPKFLKEAESSKFAKAEEAFNYSWQAEKTHKNFLVTIYDYFMTETSKTANSLGISTPSKKNLSILDNSFLAKEYYVCPEDGKLYDNSNVPSTCSLCKTTKDKFVRIK